MFGLIGKIIAISGQRDALISILIHGTSGMPGCLSYIVSKDVSHPDAIWITEVWESAGRHQNSLSLETVQQAIRLGKPLIVGFEERIEILPIGGKGLSNFRITEMRI